MTQGKHRRALSLMRTLGETAVRAGGEAFLKKMGKKGESGTEALSAAALRLADGLDELKGAAMKIGQMLSLADEDFLPPEWRTALARLQTQATPRPWNEIDPILEEHLPNRDRFASIDPEAVHAASIAQVHRGTLKDGRQVAIKVCYPGVAEGLKDDIANFRKIVKMVDVISADGGFDRIVEMVEQTFAQETDLDLERQQYERFKRALAPFPQYVVPTPYPEHSSRHVLVLEWVDGETLESWMTRHPRYGTQAATPEQQQVSTLLLELLFTEVFGLGFIQTDPNPGNFLVLPDGRLGLLDFGAVKTIPEEMRHDLATLVLAAIDGKDAEACAAGIRLGFLHHDDSAEIRERFSAILRIAARPFSQDEFSWARQHLVKEAKKAGVAFATASRLRPPPPDLLFVQRRVMGTEFMLERLGSTLPARSILCKQIAEFNREIR